MSLPVNGIERSLSRAVVPIKTKSLPVSATTFPTALSLYFTQGRLRKDIRPLFKLFSKAAPLPFEKEIMNINLVYSSCLKHANEMSLGVLRQADQRTQSFPFQIVIHQWGLCALRHGIQVLMEAILACHPAKSTE